MNKQGLLGVALRVLGLWLVLWIAFGLLLSVSLLARPTSRLSWLWLVFTLTGLALGAGLGVFLLMRGDRLSARLVRKGDATRGADADQLYRRLFAVAVRLVGLVYVLRGLAMLVQMFAPSRGDVQSGWPGWYHWHGLVGGLIALSLATYLLFGGRLPERLAFGGEKREGSHETQ